MSNDLYVRLCDRISKNARKVPPLNSVIAFLKEIFTQEQAEIGANMPVGHHTLKHLAALFNMDEGELKNILETMADEGTVFVTKNEGNEDIYGLMPFAPGIFEFQYLKGEEDEKARHRDQLIQEIQKDAKKLFTKEIALSNKMRTPSLRTLTLEEELPSNTEVATWERISNIIAGEESFAVGVCTCRQSAKLNGHSCRINAPMETCVYFGKAADFIVDRKFGRRLTREELLDLLKSFRKIGLIQNLNSNHVLMCNCCGCCCHALKPMIDHRGIKTVAKSNFVAVVDKESCIGCWECVELCQMNAIEMEDDKAVVNAEHCMGCGNCIPICPTESLKLERCSKDKPPVKDERIIGFGI